MPSFLPRSEPKFSGRSYANWLPSLIRLLCVVPANLRESSSCPAKATAFKVLVTDDNAVNQKLACALLARLGCEVDTADDGLEALQKAVEQDYGLILMDLGHAGNGWLCRDRRHSQFGRQMRHGAYRGAHRLGNRRRPRALLWPSAWMISSPNPFAPNNSPNVWQNGRLRRRPCPRYSLVTAAMIRPGYAGRLYDRLCAHFGAGQVFMDVDGIKPGDDFVNGAR